MTTDIEKRFFETFGIEKRCEFDKYCEDCKTCGCYHYPRLTDRHYLELIEILLSFEYISLKRGQEHYSVDFQGWSEQRGNSLKNAILNALIVVGNSDFKDVIYNQVRTLFEEK